MTYGAAVVVPSPAVGARAPGLKVANDPSTELRDTSYVDRIVANKVAYSTGAEDLIEELAAATGQTALRFDTTGDQFVYNWATPKVTATTCYKLTMFSADGSSQISAYFSLKR